MTTISDIARIVQDTALGNSIAESVYLYPLIESVHLLGLAVSVGLIVLIDLRLLGLALTRVPTLVLLKGVRPFSLCGFGVTFASGVLLLISEASTVVFNPAFQAKLVFIALAGANALYFESRLSAQSDSTQPDAKTSGAIRYLGLLSLVLWIAVIAFGRLIPNLRA